VGWIVLLAEDVLGLEPMSVAIFCRSALGSSSAIDQRSSTIGPEPAQGSQTSGTQRMSAATVLAGALLLLGNPVGALASPTPISVVREVMSSGPGTVPRSVRSVPSLQMPVARGDGYARRTFGVTTRRGQCRHRSAPTGRESATHSSASGRSSGSSLRLRSKR